MNLEERVKRTVVEALCLDEGIITLDSEIQNDLGADSLDAVELIMQCEDKFDIKIVDEEADQILTVEQMINLVSRKLDENK